MRGTKPHPRLRLHLRALRDAAVEKGVPIEIADYALEATARALTQSTGERFERRAEQYYSAVVRKRVIKSHGSSLAAARLVAASVVDDLVASGRDGVSVVEELERGWSERLPSAVIEEFRARLCA